MLDSTPTGWLTLTIQDIADLSAGGTPKRDVADYYAVDGIRWVKSGELRQGAIFETEEKITELGLKNSSAKLVPAGTPILAMYGATAGVVGWLSVEAATNQAVLAATPKAGFDAKFIYFLLTNVAGRLIARQQGGAQPNLSKKLVATFPVVTPPLPEQERIAEILTSVDDSIRATEAVIAQAERVKRGLMEDLLTGGLGSEAIARGEVPEGWQASIFEQLVVSMNGGVSVNSQNPPAGSNEKGVLKTSAVSNGWFNINENKVVLQDEEIARLKEPVQAGTIIFSRMNTPQLVGANAFVSESNEDVFLPDRLWAIKPNTEEVVDEWLGFWMQHQFVSGAFQSLGTGTSGSMKNISKQKLNALKVAIPTQGEQSSTVNALRAINAQIEVNKQTVDQLQTIKRGLMDDLLTGRVRTV